MKHYLLILHFMCIFAFSSSYDPFAGFARIGPCFDVSKNPACNKPLTDSLNLTNKVLGGNAPKTWIYLFSSKDENRAEPLHECGGDLPPNSIFDPKATTTIIIHGFFDGICRTAWMREVKEELFKNGPKNVILVDWTWGNSPDQVVAIGNAKVVGEQLIFTIKNIMKSGGVSSTNFHILAHSLGSLIAGYTGQGVPGLRRITVLDPSFQAIMSQPPDERFSNKDANLVDIIYTSMRDCNKTTDDERAIGHANFFPNGGQTQESCFPYILKSILKGDIGYAFASLSPSFCYHLQSIQYFKATINTNGCEFVGVESDSYEKFQEDRSGPTAVMGYGLENYPLPDGMGKYYLDTTLECPYVDNSKLKDVDPNLIKGC